MCTVQNHPLWEVNHELTLDQFKDKNKVYHAYHPKKATNYATLTALAVIGQEAFNDIKTQALKIRTLKPIGFFSVNPSNSIEVFQQKLHVSTPQEIARVADALKKMGISVTEYNRSVDKAAHIATEFFQIRENCLFEYRCNNKEIDEWQRTTVTKIQNFAYANLGMTPSPEPVNYQREELDFYKEKPIKDPTSLNCLAFALLKTKEPNASKLIFDECSDETLNRIFSFLEQWNYHNVEEPSIGDLVIYLNEEGKPSHVGYINDEGLVHSKLGIANPYSHTHHFFDIPAGYGTTLLFFQKSEEQAKKQ